MRKIRKHGDPKLISAIRSIKTNTKINRNVFTKEEELNLSFFDKVVWVYKVDEKLNIQEITSVSYVATINNKDYTVMYYDNVDFGTMHRHLRSSIQDSSDAPVSLLVKKKGHQGKLLHWAIKDIRNNWYYYRRKFFLRSGLDPEF